jgi:Arc/MetJ family transcription regulator
MATNLQIDDKLLAKAQKVGGFRTKKDTVNRALAEFVRRHEQASILELFGSVELIEGFDYKAMRAKR